MGGGWEGGQAGSLSHLFLCFVLGPGCLAILLAQGFLLFVVQQGVVFVVTNNLVLIVLQHLSQERILHQGRRQKDEKGRDAFKYITVGEAELNKGHTNLSK